MGEMTNTRKAKCYSLNGTAQTQHDAMLWYRAVATGVREAPVAPQVPGLIIPHFRTSAPRTINNQPNKRRPNATTAASPRFRNGPFTYGESLAITKALAKRARKAAAL